MSINSCLGLLLLVPLLCAAVAATQHERPLTEPGSGDLHLDVVVPEKSGEPVTGLQKEDFALLDNKVPPTITSFRDMRGIQTPIEVILVVDGINTEYEYATEERAQIGKFLRANEGHLAPPATFAVLTDKDAQIHEGFTNDSIIPSKPSTQDVTPVGTDDQSYYANAHPYLDDPPTQLVERVPALKGFQLAPDQQKLPMILQAVGRNVDEFVYNIGDLIAQEDTLQERLNAKGKIEAKEHVQDGYLILHHGRDWGASVEYRMDKKGNRLGPIGLEKGFLATEGFALSCARYSTRAQSESRFRYLGDEQISSRETYVLGFAQIPGKATYTEAVKENGGKEVDVLSQGILWVDKNSFQIIRMRTDLLAPREEIKLDQETTEVTFGAVQLPDVPNPLWLPSEVEVYMDMDGHRFRNVHHYTDYRHYGVSIRIGAAQ